MNATEAYVNRICANVATDRGGLALVGRTGESEGLMLLHARWQAFWHQLFGIFGGHRIWRYSEKPAGAVFWRCRRVFCSCGREFH